MMIREGEQREEGERRGAGEEEGAPAATSVSSRDFHPKLNRRRTSPRPTDRGGEGWGGERRGAEGRRGEEGRGERKGRGEEGEGMEERRKRGWRRR